MCCTQGSMSFILTLKINHSGLYVDALLDPLLHRQFSLEWIIGNSQFNLYTQPYTALGEKTCTNFQYVCIHCPHGVTFTHVEEKERKKGNDAGRTWLHEFEKKQSARRAEVGSQSGLLKEVSVKTDSGSDLCRSLNLSVLPFLQLVMQFVNIQLPFWCSLRGRVDPTLGFNSVSGNEFCLAQHPWVTVIHPPLKVYHLRFPSSICQVERYKKGREEIDTELKVPYCCGRGCRGALLVQDDLVASL